MKKNITINMFGQLYAIDEDAYELLKNYLDAIRQHFVKEEGGDEIADDIEGRIGELFTELKSSGVQAITIEHVENIIKRIGKPEDMETSNDNQSEDRTTQNITGSTTPGTSQPFNNQGNGSTSSIPNNNGNKNASVNKKKYYRDGNDKIIAGVLSGASNYFGGDPLAWRLGYVLFVIIWNSVSHWAIFSNFNFVPVFSIPILLYILLAFLAPCAKTPEERLKMKGKDVTPQNLADELAQEVKVKEATQFNPNGSKPRGCMNAFMTVLGVMVKIFIGAIFLFMFITFLIVFVALISIIISPTNEMPSFVDSGLIPIYNEHPFLFWITGICTLLILFIPGYCALHSLLSSSGKAAPMSMSQRWMWFGMWIGTIIVITVCGVNLSKIAHKHFIEDHIHEGVLMYDMDKTYFKLTQFHLKGKKQGDDDVWHDHTEIGDYYDDRIRYFASWDEDLLDYYQIEREDTFLTPGTYRLTAITRTDADGAYLYAIADGKKKQIAIPANGEEGGNIWEEAKTELSLHPADSLKYADIIASNDSSGCGWNKVTLDNIVLTGKNIKYGISTIPTFTNSPCYCTWVNSMDFRLERVN